MLEVGQLRCFVAVAEDMHFGRAARRLNMTQPPLSRQIRLLEDKLGVPLFVRSTRAVRLTPAGEVLLPYAQKAIAAMDGVMTQARQLAQGQRGIVRIGFTSGAAHGFLPRLVAAIDASLPDVQLDLREWGTNEQMAALARGSLDLAIIRPPDSRGGLDLHLVWQEPLRIAVPCNHRLARLERPVGADELRGETLLIYTPDENPYFHRLVSAAMDRAAFTPVRVRHIRSIHAMLGLVAAGAGVAIVPDISAGLSVPGVTLRSLAAAFAATSDLYAAWHPRFASQAAREIIDILLCQVANLSKPTVAM